MTFVVDTNTCSAYVRGHPSVFTRLTGQAQRQTRAGEFGETGARSRQRRRHDAVVKYTLGRDQSKKISRDKLHLPSEHELLAELNREIRRLPRPNPHFVIYPDLPAIPVLPVPRIFS